MVVVVMGELMMGWRGFRDDLGLCLGSPAAIVEKRDANEEEGSVFEIGEV